MYCISKLKMKNGVDWASFCLSQPLIISLLNPIYLFPQFAESPNTGEIS